MTDESPKGFHLMSRNLPCVLNILFLICMPLRLVSCSPSLYAQNKPVIGSPNVAVADPPVPRPATTPCVVQLFPEENFGDVGSNKRMDAVPHPYTYQPPAQCKGAWAKVVLQADFSVDPGHQYDRTASIWLNGVNLYFGTTEEPSPNFGPSWRVQRDLTDYTSLLRSPGKGTALVNNWVDPKRASVIHVSARILFYPASASFPAPRTPDDVYSLNGDTNAAANLQTGDDQLSRSMTLPQNATRIYMDLFAQSQFHDEFWYTCLPDQYIDQTSAFALKRDYAGAPVHARACNGGSYREAEVVVDGKPAGLAPIYPWVYTGGIDPYMWRPTPGVQTLNFVPYRLDLTPFAGLLSDGAQHTVAVRVLGANHYFSVAAALLVYRDPHAQKTGGAVTLNTLTGAILTPTVTSTLGKSSSKTNGDVLTRARQTYVIEGYVNTPAGRVHSRVEQTITFANSQTFTVIGAHTYRQITRQTAHAQGTSSSTGGIPASRRFQRSLDYLLNVDSLKRANSDGSQTKTVHLQQSYDKHIEQSETGHAPYQATFHNARTTADQVTFNATFTGLVGNKGQSSTQTYAFHDSLGDCYRASVAAIGGKVSSFTQVKNCGTSPMHWYVHPDGSPDSFGWRKPATR